MAFSRFTYDPWERTREERQAVLVGRDFLLSRLLEAVREQEGRRTLQHYIALGPRGIGKATLAHRFARFVLAGGGQAEEGGPRPRR